MYSNKEQINFHFFFGILIVKYVFYDTLPWSIFNILTFIRFTSFYPIILYKIKYT